MRKRRRSFFTVILSAPWWYALMLGGTGAAISLLLSLLPANDPALIAAARSVRSLGLAWLIACVLAAVASVVYAGRQRRRSDH
jgi:hypothetical protein